MRFNLPSMMPGFLPTGKMPPQLPVYGTDELALFKRFNRGEFLAYTGVQAPPWASQGEVPRLIEEGHSPEMAERLTRIKRWADLTVADQDPNGEYRYRYPLATGGSVEWQEQIITNELACSINLPGKYDYAKWVPAATLATYEGQGITPVVLNPMLLSTEEQAAEIATELGLTYVEQVADEKGQFFYVYPPDETRRVFGIVLPNGNRTLAGFLLRDKYRSGVGAPGHWVTGDEGYPVWVADLPTDLGEYDTRPEIPMPCRDLWPQEQIKVGGFANQIQIFNVALAPEADGDILRRIDKNVRAIHDSLIHG